jgi:Mce-associated membrane protein
MEGDAGTSRLNPTDQTDTQVKAEDSPESETVESETGADQVTAVIKTEDSAESEPSGGDVEAAVVRGPSRMSRGWLAGITAVLLLAAAGIGVGGCFALHYHHGSQAIARHNAAALEAAKVCIAATQAPDTTTIAKSERQIIDCGTDEYRSQALLYTSMLVQAYQAANIHVQVTDQRAAILGNNNDGSVDILVALRVKVSNSTAQNQETGYRLRVRMAPVDGQYKIAKLDQVMTK